MHDNYETECFDAFFEHRKRSFFYKGRAKIIDALLKGKIADNINRSKIIKIVDIGFGHGTKLPSELINRVRLVGIDVNFDSLSRIKKLSDSKALFVNADALALPFKESFEMVLLLDVLEHIDDDEKALRNIHDILKKDGLLVMMVPAVPSLYSKFDRLAFHKRRYALKELERKLTRAGFSVKKISYFIFFLFPLIYVFRKMRELFISSRSSEDIGITDMAEIKVIPVINELCLATLIIESWLISKFSFPFGSSIVAVAAAKK